MMRGLSILFKYIIKFAKLNILKKRIAGEVVLITAIIRLIIIIFPFRKVAGLCGKYKYETSFLNDQKQFDVVNDISWWVNIISDKTPWESKCLVRALTAQIMLRIRGIQTTLYLGVAKEDEKIKAHAWLRWGSFLITGARQYARFTEVAKFATLCGEENI